MQKNPQTPDAGASRPGRGADGKDKGENLFSASVRVLGKPIKMVCDPIAQVCYPVLEQHWQERYRKPWPERYARRMLILDVALLTAIATLIVAAGLFYFVVPLFPVPAIVNLSVLAPKVLVSGAPTEYDVAYDNSSTNTLGCAVLRVHLPPGTVTAAAAPATGSLETACPAPGEPTGQAAIESDGPEGPTLLYTVGNIAPHGRDLIRIEATTYGPTGSQKVLTAELLYWEEAETAPTRVSTRGQWSVDHSALSLDATAPEQTGRRTITFSYANVLDRQIGPLAFRVALPDDFEMTGSSLPQSSRDTWTIGVLDANERGTLAVTGDFKETQGARPPSTFTLSVFAQANGREFLLEQLRRDVNPKTTGFTLTHAVVSPGRDALLPGDEVKVAVTYQNDSPQALRDVTVRLVADPRFATAAAPANLVWDAKTSPQLARIASGAGGTLIATFTVTRDIPQDALANEETPTLRISSEADFTIEGTPNERLTVDSAETALPIATRLGIQAAGLYFTKDGDQLGVGPLPPQAGKTTKYRVFLDVSSGSGDASDVTVDATLPPNVEWTGRYSVNGGQAIDWLPTSRIVRWNAGTVPSYTNSQGEHIGASFEVSLTPGDADVGTVPVLVRGIELRGKDLATGLSLHATAEPITTDLPFDKRAAGKGTVVQ